MRRINIAIIDSGVNAEQVPKDCNIEYVYSCEGNDFGDVIGHGTNVIQTILSHEKRLNIYIFKIFGKRLSCDLQELLNALNKIYIEYPSIDVVNMSLGIPEGNDKLKYYCDELSNRGVKLIAAYNNCDGIDSFPAKYSCVYGVKAELYYNCYEYSISTENNVKIYGYLPYFLIEMNHITCMANSFAAAHYSGIVSKELLDVKEKEIIEEKDFKDYKKQLGDFSWMNKVIIVDDRMRIDYTDFEKKKINMIGICNIENDRKYAVVYKEKTNTFYDTLVVDNFYSSNKGVVLNFIMLNIKKGKNVFCVTGFGREVDFFLYMLSQKNGCKFYIKYVC